MHGWKRKQWKFDVVQHWGIRNTRPSAHEARAVSSWLIWANSQTDFEMLDQALIERESKHDEIMELTGDQCVERDLHALACAMPEKWSGLFTELKYIDSALC